MSKPQKIKNRDGSISWRIRFLNADGKRESRTYSTESLAKSELRRYEVDAEDTAARRARFGPAEMTVSAAWQTFKSSRRPDPNNTERRFRKRGAELERCYVMHIEPHLGSTKLGDLTPSVLRGWVTKLMTTKTARPGETNADGRTLSASTIRQCATTLRQIAKANDHELHVPLGESLKQKRRRTRPRALQGVEDVRALLKACGDPWFKVAAAIACYSGARLGEVASLRWRNIDTEAERISIEMSWEGPLKARYEDDDEGPRIVPLDPELAAILKAWRKLMGGLDDDRIVLVGGVRPLEEGTDDVSQKTRSACMRAGLPPLTFHSLRASFATILADNGVPIPRLQKLMGHADATTTAIYLRGESSHAAADPRARLSYVAN